MADTSKLAQIDKAMGFKNETLDGVDWYSADSEPMELSGFYWRKPGEPFRRIPLDASISEGVDYLAWHTSGGILRFRTNSPEIRVHAIIDHNDRMNHMATTGSMGFDLYHGSGTAKYYAGTARFDQTKDEYNVSLLKLESWNEMREYTLHFPLYAGLKYVRIGLTEGAGMEAPSPWKDPRPIVVYGTSIQQGGCASRPGMSHTNQMCRLLNRPFLNLAFSGSGKGEPQMAELIADIRNPAMFVLDYDANANVEGLDATLPTFIEILRKKHPVTPILLVSRLLYENEFLQSQYTEERLGFTRIHLRELNRRREMGDLNIHFLDGTALYGPDPSECTVDGCHATDLGFYQIAHRMAPVIERILSFS